ncbi:MAG: DNA ligase D [Chloroflexota bacterium]
MVLDEYRAKRDFTRTAEPAPGEPPGPVAGPLRYVIQKHAARRLHYDFRLEVDGVLKSWPIPNGPSYTHGIRRLAVMTEDHPVEYATFEGVIPKGEYGGGQVIVWDAGIYAPENERGAPCFERERAEKLVQRGIARGRLTVFLLGTKLRGGWSLVHTQDKQWLFLKKDDGTADPTREVLNENASILSGVTIEDLTDGVPVQRRTHLLFEPDQATGARRGPQPRDLTPMLPSISNTPFVHSEWLFEPKLDGYRVLASVRRNDIRLTSRRGLDCSAEYPWLVEALRQQPYRDALFDGEVVALGEDGKPSFGLLQNKQSAPNLHLVYFVFDLLHRDGVDLRNVPLSERKRLLAASLYSTDRLQMVPVFAEDGVSLFNAVRESGMEGVVAKRLGSRYEGGKRTDSWLKIKAHQSDEFVVGGYTLGSGSRALTFGSLVLGYYKPGADRLTYIGHAGSGFDAHTLASVYGQLQDLRVSQSPFDGPVPTVGRWVRPGKSDGPITWVKPELVAQVKYAEITSDGILRAPVFMGLRDDKVAASVGPLAEAIDASTQTSDGPRQRNVAHTEGAWRRLAEPGLERAGTAPERRDAMATEAAERLAQALEAGAENTLTLAVEGCDIKFSNLNKVFWPAHGEQRALTKRDLLIYFARVSTYLLPHLKDRPLTLVRFPNGISGGHFYQKHYEQPLPPFVQTVRLYSDHNAGDGKYLLGNNLATLLWLGQVADIELHTWYSRIDATGDGAGLPRTFAGSLENIHASALNFPDFVVFDLDPYLYSGKETRGAEPELHRDGFAATCEAALRLKESLDGLGLSSFVKTTGRTGLHVYVPITRTLDFHATHVISETLARHLEQQFPDLVTTEWTVGKRTGKVFADYNQNVRGKTLASVYSPRVLPWAAVSMPLRWDEVGNVFPTDFTILTAPDRLRQTGDLWSGILASKHDLAELLG